ncbi:hypothetical protein ONZ51_g5325 [Trametes cubensis]|uniref:SET domain-containing protein n=1 Tax=Trametes cubensis TaxID=1111947 RepID=A0AAD7TWM6_9APHY|nr:hypothetical protein ONZ51_g5325 [Trametes cubensis]
MSFGKLKSQRKAKELHSFVKLDDPHQTANSEESSLIQAADANTLEVHENAMGTASIDDSEHTQRPSLDQPAAKKPRIDDPSDGGAQQGEEHAGKHAGSEDHAVAMSLPVPEQDRARPAQLHGCHRSLPASLQILETGRHGRGIYAKSALHAGSVIMSVTPHVSVLSTQYLDQYCSACAAPATETGLKRCPKCKTVYYCNQECQNRDWAWHKRVSSPGELEPFGLNSAGDLVDLISRFTTNTFTLTSPSLTPIGICIAPTVAFANHSCDPNAVIVFPKTPGSPATMEPLLNLIALRDVPPGKEIRIAYIDTTLPKQIRHKELKETYNFTCQCKVCTRQVVVDPHPAKALQLTTNIIPILTSAGVTPSSYPLLAMTHLHQELLIATLPSSLSQESLDDAIRAAAKYSAGLQSLLPKGHPVRAVALGELGKLLGVDEPAPPTDPAQASKFPPSGPARLKLAYESLVRAHEELLIGFGKPNQGGYIGKDVREAIIRLERELGIWTSGIKNTLEDAMLAQRASSSR